MKDREQYASITFKSMLANFEKVFGRPHDALAEMIFRYMADIKKDKENIDKIRVTYLTFLKKFIVLIPNKPVKFS